MDARDRHNGQRDKRTNARTEEASRLLVRPSVSGRRHTGSKSESFSHDTRFESRFRFSTPKIGAGFRPRVSSALDGVWHTTLLRRCDHCGCDCCFSLVSTLLHSAPLYTGLCFVISF